MKSKTTAIWFVLAAALFAAIWICQNIFPARRAGHRRHCCPVCAPAT